MKKIDYDTYSESELDKFEEFDKTRNVKPISIQVSNAITILHPAQSEIKIEIMRGSANLRQREERTLCFHKDSYKELKKVAKELRDNGSQYLQKNENIKDFNEAFTLLKKEILERKW